MKKSTLFIGAICAFVSQTFAATDTVWTESGNGTKAPAYWYIYTDGKATIDTTLINNVKTINITVTAGNTSNSAGYGFGWKQDPSNNYKEVPISLAAYKGVCLTYKATAPLRVDFKQSTITNHNYFGANLSAAASFKKTFLDFADITKENWGSSSSKVAWDATKQLGIQFAYKNTLATATQNTNTIEISSIILADECETHAPELLEPYKSATNPDSTLNEGDTLKLDLGKIFTDADGDELEYSVQFVTANAGVVKLASDTISGSIMKFVTIPNPSGTSKVSITATDPTKKTATYTFTVTTVDRENAPVAVNDDYSMNEDETLTVKATNSVLKNDYDADGDDFIILKTSVTDPAHGTLEFDSDLGTFTYTPEKDYYGTDSFTYQIVETKATQPKTSAAATVTIDIANVDDPAVVIVKDSSISIGRSTHKLGDTLELNEDFEDVSVKIPTANVDFTDPDGALNLKINAKSSGVLTAEYAKLGVNHIISLSAIKNANGLAKVTLFAFENKDTVSVCFYVKVLPVKDPPIANADTFDVIQDSLNTIAAKKGVLVNDTNPDGKSTLKAYLKDDATNGKVTLETDGSFTYAAGKSEGKDSFTYYVINAEGDTSNAATVTLSIKHKNQPPQIVEGVLDTIGESKLSKLTEDFTTIIRFTAITMQSWFVDDSTEASKLKFATRSDDSLLAPSIVNNALQIKSVKNACGDAEVIVIASDAQGASTELAIPAKIACVNDKPLLKKLADTIYVDSNKWASDIDLNDYVTDVDGDTLEFTLTTNKIFDENLTHTLDKNILSVSVKDSVEFENSKTISLKVKAADATTYVQFNLLFILGKKTTEAISVKLATPKISWKDAIKANYGTAAIFDLQGRVIWKHALPVSEAQVKVISTKIMGRKILQIGKQIYSIK